MGSFNNYVDQILSVLTIYLYWVDNCGHKYYLFDHMTNMEQPPNVHSENKYTKHSSVLLLRLVYLFSERTLEQRYFKKQHSLSSFLLTWSRFTG